MLGRDYRADLLPLLFLQPTANRAVPTPCPDADRRLLRPPAGAVIDAETADYPAEYGC
jgi:hypothetical protein